MPATRISDRFDEHLHDVKTLAAEGIPAPKEWVALYERYTSYQAMQLPACDRLIAAIIAPSKGDDVTALHGLALAETASPQTQAQVDNRVAAAVERRLRELYRPSARTNYEQAAARFNSVASDFATAAAVTDVEVPAADVVNASDDQRSAWTAAEQHAIKLDTLVPVLAAAAELAGVGVNGDTALLPLCCDPADKHRRRVWEAWIHEGGRCRRWSALHRLGVVIRAANLDTFARYDEPLPYETRTEQVAGALPGTMRTTRLDPHDESYTPPKPPQKKMIGGRMAAI
ncbi:hypothetical protein A5704_00915 [Mycobacterium sp. E735]|nr:hypothetical protein A5704_00915 [Mycobacterium sp. E735]